MKNNLLTDILKNQVTPALGCTEPGAVAYGVAIAKEILGSEVKKLNIEVDKNILKNGFSVGIPGTNEHGIIFAAALSLVIGKSEYLLEVLKDVDDNSIEKAIEIVDSNIIDLKLKPNTHGLYIKAEAVGDKDTAEVIIRDSHTNIIFERKNEQVLFEKADSSDTLEKKPKNEIKFEIKNFAIDELIDYADRVPLDEISFIQKGIDMNLKIADAGLNECQGVGLGNYMYKKAGDVFTMAKAYTAAASEARMSGYLLPVMSSAGSGNHGLVAVIPISYIGREQNVPNEKILRSVALSHLITIYVKVYLGALSPVCGCGVAAGVGCAAGLTYMLDGDKEQIKGSINNMIAGVSGMLCDGAKLGCAYKLSISVDAAVDAAKMALENIYIPEDNGILGSSAESSIQNLARVSNLGMDNTDEVILDVIINKC